MISLKKKNIGKQLSYVFFRIIRRIAQLVYPKIEFEGIDKLPDGPCLLIGNHSQINGPIIGELYVPGKHATWCAGEMMELKEVPAYAYRDFWSMKPKYSQWFYKLLSYLIAPLSVCVFNNADTIAVHRDCRIISTFRETVNVLSEGYKVTIFPEEAEKHNNIVNQFQEGFVDIARMYKKKCGSDLAMVPIYIAPKLRKVYVGQAVYLDASAPKAEERRRVCTELMSRISDMAYSLPEHTVVPYLNMPKKLYPKNIPSEVNSHHEEAPC